MNKIHGIIKKIDVNGLVSLLDIDCSGIIIKVLILQVPTLFKEGDPMELFVKESELLIAKQSSDKINKDFISVENIIDGKITKINHGKIFTEIVAETKIGNMIVVTESEAFDKLKLSASSDISLLIKANSIGLGAV